MTVTITPKPATGNGDIDGFEVRCSECGFLGSSSLRTQAESMYQQGHEKFCSKPERVCAWCFTKPQEIGVHCQACLLDLNDAAGTYEDFTYDDEEADDA